jgi:pimeloyl-ACP methyl ester carboxylesterase
VAGEQQATRAVGISRGARAVLGGLAEQPDRFDRVVLLLPPAGSPAGRYTAWLAGLDAGTAPTADILILAQRGDQIHPLRVAQEWAELLGGRLEVCPWPQMRPTLVEFLNS